MNVSTGGLRGRRRDGLFGTALAGDKNADALDHFGRRTGALGQEDICVKSAIEGVDGAGDDHRGQTRMKLFGASNQFVAIHLRHQEIAEDQVEGAGKRSLKNLQRLLRVFYCGDAVTSGFEKKGADRKDLFVVIYAENRLLGAHAVSLLPDATFWWLATDGPACTSAGLQAHRSGGVQIAPWFGRKRLFGT
jgi:hypothetical protein